MRRRYQWIGAAALVGLVYGSLPVELRTTPTPPPRQQPAVLTLEAVQALSELVTTKLVLHQEACLLTEGYLGELSVRWDGSGSVLLGPDLSQAQITERDEGRHTATIVLPEPRVLAATLDLDGGRLQAQFDGLWQLTPSERLQARQQAAVLAMAQGRLKDAVTSKQKVPARHTAEAAVSRLGQALNWTLIVRWNSPGPASPLR